MTVDLDKYDLIRMVKGVQPGYEHHSYLQGLRLGSYSGGFNDCWKWSYMPFLDLTEKELWDVYSIIKPKKNSNVIFG